MDLTSPQSTVEPLLRSEPHSPGPAPAPTAERRDSRSSSVTHPEGGQVPRSRKSSRDSTRDSSRDVGSVAMATTTHVYEGRLIPGGM